jgi:chemotaxis protein CheZ
MMSIVNSQHLDRIQEFLRARGRADVSLSDVVALAEITAASLETLFQSMDLAVHRELRDIAEYIRAMKVEIGVLRVADVKERRIPAAGVELGAIVKATEAATNTIMECAEAVMAAEISDPAAFKTLVQEKMLLIFEACSFQDITGQRIAKVIETLEHIEARVSRFAALDLEGDAGEAERERAERARRLLLHGPPSDGEGMAQKDIDRLMA